MCVWTWTHISHWKVTRKITGAFYHIPGAKQFEATVFHLKVNGQHSDFCQPLKNSLFQRSNLLLAKSKIKNLLSRVLSLIYTSKTIELVKISSVFGTNRNNYNYWAEIRLIAASHNHLSDELTRNEKSTLHTHKSEIVCCCSFRLLLTYTNCVLLFVSEKHSLGFYSHIHRHNKTTTHTQN